MNADQDEAMGLLGEPGDDVEGVSRRTEASPQQQREFWCWRMQMVERVAAELDPNRFGVAGFYVVGSTKNLTARADSDIDIVIHFRGSDKQLEQLKLWLEGWGLCLAEMNYMRTGHRLCGLLDIHIVTDEDIAENRGYAAKIGAITDPARELKMKTDES